MFRAVWKLLISGDVQSLDILKLESYREGKPVTSTQTLFTMSTEVQMDSRQRILQFTLIGLVLLAFGPFLYALCRRLWSVSYYSFFPVYVGVLVWIGWTRIRNQIAWPNPRLIDIARCAVPFALLFVAIKLNSHVIGSAAFLLVIRILAIAVVPNAWTNSGIRSVWFALWLCIPIPFGIDEFLVQNLQHLASSLASRIFDWLEMPHLLTGVLLQFSTRTFEIEKACSGIESIYAAMAATWCYCVLRKHGLLRTLTLLIACVFWVLAANTMRIVLVGVCELKWSIPAAAEPTHSLIGFCTFLSALSVVACSDRFLSFLVPQRLEYEQGNRIVRNQLQAMLLRPIAVTPTLTSLSVLLGGLVVWNVFAQNAQAEQTSRRVKSGVVANERSMPEEFNGWTRTGFEHVERNFKNINGENSWVWDFRRNGLDVKTSVDGPFKAWHNLAWCYRSQGWHIRRTSDFTLIVDREKVTATQIEMENDSGEESFVLFAALDEFGRPTPPPSVFRVGNGMRLPIRTNAVRQFWSSLNGRKAPKQPGVVHQVQLMAKLPAAPTSAEKKHFKELFQTVFKTASSRLFDRGEVR